MKLGAVLSICTSLGVSMRNVLAAGVEGGGADRTGGALRGGAGAGLGAAAGAVASMISSSVSSSFGGRLAGVGRRGGGTLAGLFFSSSGAAAGAGGGRGGSGVRVRGLRRREPLGGGGGAGWSGAWAAAGADAKTPHTKKAAIATEVGIDLLARWRLAMGTPELRSATVGASLA